MTKSPEFLILETGGVGYQAAIPLSTYYGLPEPGQRVDLHIHTRLREDALKLFGFLTAEEKNVFETLIGINKVGPKLALTILSGLPVDQLMQAVAQNDVARLSSIPGVGRKTAERLALELRDKLVPLTAAADSPTAPAHPHWDDALSALVNLGYKKGAAEKALQKLCRNSAPESLEALIRDSLNLLSP